MSTFNNPIKSWTTPLSALLFQNITGEGQRCVFHPISTRNKDISQQSVTFISWKHLNPPRVHINDLLALALSLPRTNRHKDAQRNYANFLWNSKSKSESGEWTNCDAITQVMRDSPPLCAKFNIKTIHQASRAQQWSGIQWNIIEMRLSASGNVPLAA